jgi:RNA polymerase sigma-70 factor (ECF subfamily)
MSVDVSNHELMKRIKNSDHYAFTTLYNRLWESHYTKAFSLTGNKSIAQDTVQEVWISFWERREKIQNDNIEGYLIKAIRF